MSAVSQLINVSYQDRTNYTAEVGGDVMGIPLIHPWGPTGKLLVLNEQQFYETYPEEFLSPAVFSKYPEWLYSYGTVKQAFANGLKQVEVYGLMPNCVASTDAAKRIYICVNPTSHEASVSTEIEATNVVYMIDPKYSGIPSAQLGIGIICSQKDDGVDYDYEIYVKAFTKSAENRNITDLTKSDDILYSEHYTGLWSSEQIINGEDNSIEAILKDSQLVKCERVSNADVIARPQMRSAAAMFISATLIDTNTISYDNVSTVINMNKSDYYKWFGDMRRSQATMLCSPFGYDILDTELAATARDAQDRIAVIGRKINASISDESSAINTLNKYKDMKNMFSVLVSGADRVNVNGMTVKLNCVGGFIGRTAAVASQYRTNQPASAFTYGAPYIGTLRGSMDFDTVLNLHDMGMCSVFNDINGPTIWGIRTLYKNQNSYFAKLNVIRVLAEILRQVFPICLQAIHTDAAANEQTASDYETKFMNILDYEVSQQNIKSDSVAVCTGSINSDKNTKGGKIFNLLLSLHFIGLVEKVNISVVATDSSVSAQIV